MLPVLDLILVLVSLLCFVCIGFYFRPPKNATTTDYFLAGKTMSSVPAGFSITVSFISSVSLTLFIGEISKYGYPFYMMAVAGFVAGPVIIYLVVPQFYITPYISVYQFLEDRYSLSVRIANSFVFICAGIINASVVGYSAAISAETLAGVPFWLSAVSVGLLSTAYSTLGGVKAVIWTDFAQAFLMVMFFVFILIKALMSFDSVDEVWSLATAGGRNGLLFAEGPTHRYTLQSTLIYYIVFFMFLVAVSQPSVQRWKSVPTLKAAQRTVVVSLVLFGVFSILSYFTGLVLYAFYARCNIVRPIIPSDKISLHFVVNELSSWPGVIGLCLAGILSSALSTISSFINSFSAVTLEDFIKLKLKSLTTSQELLFSKALTLAYGLLVMTLIFMANEFESAAAVHLISYALSMSPPLAVFLLGLWCKRTNTVGVTLGLVSGVSLLLWISVGSLYTGNRHVPLPVDNPLCLDTNITMIPHAEWTSSELLKNKTTVEPSWPFASLYTIAFQWYAAIGLAASGCLGYVCSLLYNIILRTRENRLQRPLPMERLKFHRVEGNPDDQPTNPRANTEISS